MPIQYTVHKSFPKSYTPEEYTLFLLEEIDNAIFSLQQLPKEAFKDWEFNSFLTDLTKKLNVLNEEYGE